MHRLCGTTDFIRTVAWRQSARYSSGSNQSFRSWRSEPSCDPLTDALTLRRLDGILRSRMTESQQDVIIGAVRTSLPAANYFPARWKVSDTDMPRRLLDTNGE